MKDIDSLFVLTKSGDIQVATTALRVLAEVFVAVAPTEAVNLKEIGDRRSVKITKDEFKVIRFE